MPPCSTPPFASPDDSSSLGIPPTSALLASLPQSILPKIGSEFFQIQTSLSALSVLKLCLLSSEQTSKYFGLLCLVWPLPFSQTSFSSPLWSLNPSHSGFLSVSSKCFCLRAFAHALLLFFYLRQSSFILPLRLTTCTACSLETGTISGMAGSRGSSKLARNLSLGSALALFTLFLSSWWQKWLTTLPGFHPTSSVSPMKRE